MALQGDIFALDEAVVFRGRSMRVTGRVQFEDSGEQMTYRYQLSDDSGAPVIVEQGQGRFSVLRPFPPAARFKTADNTILVGTAKYTLVSVRKLKALEFGGNAAGIAAKAALILCGTFEGLMGTLMREMVPGTARQVYYLLKPLADGEILSAAKYAAGQEADGRAAGQRALDSE